MFMEWSLALYKSQSFQMASQFGCFNTAGAEGEYAGDRSTVCISKEKLSLSPMLFLLLKPGAVLQK